ncbi:hypothetical protein MDUV_12960 [Mycolicibacterium duvalii]|uniref:Uncharacterized protein n=1 Tax=Mycolicibacterium duvalii TaxID=39688 RepID=A0A7I7JX68_9MYCO|nr:hypothetical protein MDUV_12960 [Mycolicibacterium duvalii]
MLRTSGWAGGTMIGETAMTLAPTSATPAVAYGRTDASIDGPPFGFINGDMVFHHIGRLRLGAWSANLPYLLGPT